MNYGVGQAGRQALSPTERVAESIRTAILSGAVYPGEILNQAALANQYSVSKLPVREALTQLMAEGLVGREHHRGFFVPRLSLGETRQLYLMRCHVETELLRTMDWPDSGSLALLVSLQKQASTEAALDRGFGQYQALEQLRSAVFALSPEKVFFQEARRLWLQIDRLRAFLPTESEYGFIGAFAERDKELVLEIYRQERARIDECLETALNALPISFRESWMAAGATRSNGLRGMQGDRGWKPVNWLMLSKQAHPAD